MNARWLGMISFFVILLTSAHALPTPRVIGIEGSVKVTLARSDYQPKPMDDRTALILRLETVTPAANETYIYDFHYIGFEPGSYRLADYLIHPDGTLATEIGDTQVEVHSILPVDHGGVLNSQVSRPFPWIGGYRMILGSLATLWLLGLLLFAWMYRRKKPIEEIDHTPPVASYAERMRPFVEAAAAGNLSPSGQAQLERLMTGYWREKLALPEQQRMADSLVVLMKDREAGPLLRALEHWLHRPGGASAVEVNTLLKPYHHSPVATIEEVQS